MNIFHLPSDLYCVMGNPVAHPSPAIHARFAELTGQHLRYERRLVARWTALRTHRAAFAHRRAGGRGCNITVPFKFEARPGHPGSERVRWRACRQHQFATDGSIRADNTDGLGLVADITRNAACRWPGARLLLGGAGAPRACWARCCGRPPHHHCQPHRGQGAGAGGIAQRPGGATKAELLALALQALGRF